MKTDNAPLSPENLAAQPRGSSLSHLIPSTLTPKLDAPLPLNPRRPGPLKRQALWISAAIVIGLPTILAASYYLILASDQFASYGHFVVRHRGENNSAISSLSILGIGSGATSSESDMLIVNDYMHSMQLIKDLQDKINLRKIFSDPAADWFARLKPGLGKQEITDERLLDYWKKMAVVHFDSSTGLSTFEIRAFRAEDAKQIADHVFKLGEKLVNRLSERAQEDALQLARKEVDEYRHRAVKALDALQVFQERARQVDPEAFAKVRSGIQAGVETRLSQIHSQLDVLRNNLPESAPGVLQLKDRLSAMEKRLADEKQKSTTSESGESASQILNEFAKLRLESEFATQAYLSSLGSLENARIEAMRQNLYLETFVRPHTPQTDEYPKRLLNILLVFVVASLVWAIGGLFVSAIREHI